MVLGLSGSPRRGANSETLLDWALEGAQGEGAQTEKLVISEMAIAPCRDCDECQAAGECTIHDDMDLIYPKIPEAAALIFASPVYFRGVTAQAKALIDRCNYLWIRKYLLHQPVASQKRPGLFIATAGQDRPGEFEPSIATVRSFFATADVDYVGELLFPGMDEAGSIRNHPSAREQALAAGSRLVSLSRGGSWPRLTRGKEEAPTVTDWRPIGVVRNNIKEPMVYGWETVVSELVVNPELAPAVEGVEDYSHLVVVTWMHRVPWGARGLLRIHPKDRQEIPLMGVFATRTQHRPNPIGMAVVRLLERKGNILQVVGLDAIDGTPILDIKPHVPYYDSPTDVKLPRWTKHP